MLTIRRNEDRGPTTLSWLKSLHSFSFAGYYDPRFMGVSALRVINDDKVVAGAGFGAHSHQDMEIISYVTRGTIEHKDSMGNIERLPAGEFQLMSAGSGITHSEYNPSHSEPLEFFQIWIQPNVFGIAPGYQQKRFAEHTGLQLIASPDARDGSMLIHQAAELWRIKLDEGGVDTYSLESGRTAYIHVVAGELAVNGERLYPGDGVTVTDTVTVGLNAPTKSEAMLFDLP